MDGLAKLKPDAPHVLSLERGFACTNAACGAPLALPSMVVQLELAIRSYIAQYYHAWSICTESTCGARTNQTGVYSGRCLVQGCRGKTKQEYSDKELYNQLCYLDYLFDAERALAEIGDGPQRKYVQDTMQAHKESIGALHALVQQYLGRNGRRYVGLRKLFGFMRV